MPIANKIIPFTAPFKGISNISSNNVEYAKSIQNMQIGDGNNLVSRYGTKEAARLGVFEGKFFTDPVEVMSFLSKDGLSEKLLYQAYFSKIDWIAQIEKEEVGYTKLILTIKENHIEDAKKLEVGFRLRLVQSNILITSIESLNLKEEENKLELILPISIENLDDQIEIEQELAGIYKLGLSGQLSEELISGLDSEVLVSHVNYLGVLLITNGVDPLMVYDGEDLIVLKPEARLVYYRNSRPILSEDRKSVTFTCAKFFQQEVISYFAVGQTVISLTRSPEEYRTSLDVTSILKEDKVDSVKFTITFDKQVGGTEPIDSLLYAKDLPIFGTISVVHDRLWATAGGRCRKNKFKPNGNSMLAYYAHKSQSYEDWFNTSSSNKSGIAGPVVGFINISSNISRPDNLELIAQFRGKTLFICRNSIQIWSGSDPTTLFDGNDKIDFSPLKFSYNIKTGVLHHKLVLEIANDLVLLTKNGVVPLAIDNNRQITALINFSEVINGNIQTQLVSVKNDRDFRAMRMFFYQFGNFAGIKIKYNCLIYQTKHGGVWSIFSDNFASARSFFYDPVSENLYLAMEKGILLKYADKIGEQSFKDAGKGLLTWRIHYDWVYPNLVWHNESVAVACRALADSLIKVRIYTDSNDTDFDELDIMAEEVGSLYGNAEFGKDVYASKILNFPFEKSNIRFEAVMLVVEGTIREQLVFDKILFRGNPA